MNRYKERKREDALLSLGAVLVLGICSLNLFPLPPMLKGVRESPVVRRGRGIDHCSEIAVPGKV